MNISKLKSISGRGLITLAAGVVSSFVFLLMVFTAAYVVGEALSFAINKLLLASIKGSIKDVLVGISVLSGICSFGFSIYLSCVSCGKSFDFSCIQLSKTTNQEPVTDADVFTWSMIGSFLLVFIIGSVSAPFNPPHSSAAIEVQKVSDIAPSIRTGTDAKVSDEHIENLFSNLNDTAAHTGVHQ
jgi:hypothetical protein